MCLWSALSALYKKKKRGGRDGEAATTAALKRLTKLDTQALHFTWLATVKHLLDGQTSMSYLCNLGITLEVAAWPS